MLGTCIFCGISDLGADRCTAGCTRFAASCGDASGGRYRRHNRGEQENKTQKKKMKIAVHNFSINSIYLNERSERFRELLRYAVSDFNVLLFNFG